MRISKNDLQRLVDRLSVTSGRDLALDTSYGQYGVIDHTTGHRLAHQQPARQLYNLLTEGLELAEKVEPSIWEVMIHDSQRNESRRIFITATHRQQAEKFAALRLCSFEKITSSTQIPLGLGHIWVPA